MKEVAVFSKGGYVTKQDASEGSIPVISGGLEPACYHNQFNRSGESIVIARSGVNAGYVSYWNVPIYVSDTFTIDPDSSILTHKYLYYCLKRIQSTLIGTKRGAGVPHINKEALSKIIVPLVDLSEQSRITRILDRFDSLYNDLSQSIPAELEVRQKQYEYYRNKLLSFNEC